MANIYEVAEHSGVSIATVSRFFNSPERVAAATRAKIQLSVEALDFVPSRVAVHRARQNMKRVGIVIPGLTHTSFTERIRGVSAVLPPSEYDLIIYPAETRAQLDSYLDMLLTAGRIDGLILMSLPFSDTCAGAFRGRHIPVVSVERDLTSCGISSVVVSNFQGGMMAASYLLDRGFLNPAFIGNGGQEGYSFSAARERLRGFKAELKKRGLYVPDEHLILYYGGLQQTAGSLKEMLSSDHPPDCVFAATDREAMIVLQTAPGGFGVFGFDYTEFAGILGITTIDQRLEESGREAARLLLQHIKEPELGARVLTLSLEIRPGKSA